MSKRAEPNIVDVLVASGVDVSVWHMPAELAEDHHGPPIAYDDLLDFHFQLQSDDWLQELYSLRRSGLHGTEPASPLDQ